MRELGYHFWGQKKETGEMAFIRPIKGIPYPRFHIWLKAGLPTGQAGKKTDGVFFNLHLDQKKPIYKGIPAHSGEYAGEVVEKEAERIKKFFLTLK